MTLNSCNRTNSKEVYFLVRKFLNFILKFDLKEEFSSFFISNRKKKQKIKGGANHRVRLHNATALVYQLVQYKNWRFPDIAHVSHIAMHISMHAKCMSIKI